MSDYFRLMNKQFHMTRDARLYHSHHLDAANGERRLRRLPDRTLVYADEYEERLREYEERERASGRGDG